MWARCLAARAARGLSRQHIARPTHRRQHRAVTAAQDPDTRPLVVVALGGNALLKRGEPLTAANQQANAAVAARAVAELAEGYRLVVTHGNGPQVGLLALQDPEALLDVLDAETEGELGYLLELELRNALPGHEVATLLTQAS